MPTLSQAMHAGKTRTQAQDPGRRDVSADHSLHGRTPGFSIGNRGLIEFKIVLGRSNDTKAIEAIT